MWSSKGLFLKILILVFAQLLLTYLLGYNITAKNIMLFILLMPLSAAVPSHQFKHDLFSRFAGDKSSRKEKIF